MKNSVFLIIFFWVNFSGASTRINICPTCPDTIPDSVLLKQIVESTAAPVVDSFVRVLKDEVYKVKMKQDSVTPIIDSIYNQKFKRRITGRIDQWFPVKGDGYKVYWRYYVYPNGDTLYDTIDSNRIKRF